MPTPFDRKTFVLVHGSSAGGWCYRAVADLLERRGHKVYAPTLTGLGERSHLMSGLITLNTHITDVVNLIRWEDLHDFVLVGHSYGGWIISGVAEQVEGKIASIVFLDAFMPEDGQSVLDTNSPRSCAEIEQALKRAEGVAAGAASFRARDRVPKKTYVRATGYENPNFDRFYAKVKSDRSWRTYEIPCGHEMMIDMPERTAEILMEVA